MNKPSHTPSGTSSLLVWISFAAAFLLLLYSDFVSACHYEDSPFGRRSPAEPTGNVIALPSDLNKVSEGLPDGFRAQLEQSLRASGEESGEKGGSGGYSAEELKVIRKYYSESAFLGDSLLIMYRQYLQKHDPDSIFTKSTMLCAYSFSTRAALRPVTPKSIHPFYRGKKQPVWESLRKSGKKRVFIIFWANEIPDANIENANTNLERMVAKIREACPGIEIHIVSPCYMYKDTPRTSKTDHINNPNLHALALSRKEFCRTHDAGYVEVSKYLGNEKDGLYERYTSDKFVHLNDAAYDIWVQVFSDYALGREPDSSIAT